jgi:hypothetical protein
VAELLCSSEAEIVALLCDFPTSALSNEAWRRINVAAGVVVNPTVRADCQRYLVRQKQRTCPPAISPVPADAITLNAAQFRELEAEVLRATSDIARARRERYLPLSVPWCRGLVVAVTNVQVHDRTVLLSRHRAALPTACPLTRLRLVQPARNT